MDRFASRCWLDWWANPSTNLGGVPAWVAVTSTDPGWELQGQLMNPHDRSALAFLHELDPVFALRFPDGSTILVTVTLTEATHRFTLTEYSDSTGLNHTSSHS